jgi:hypothetical protein
VTERERVIRLNGIGGVRFQKTRIEISIRVFSLRIFVILSEAKLQRSGQKSARAGFQSRILFAAALE